MRSRGARLREVGIHHGDTERIGKSKVMGEGQMGLPRRYTQQSHTDSSVGPRHAVHAQPVRDERRFIRLFGGMATASFMLHLFLTIGVYQEASNRSTNNSRLSLRERGSFAERKATMRHLIVKILTAPFGAASCGSSAPFSGHSRGSSAACSQLRSTGFCITQR